MREKGVKYRFMVLDGFLWPASGSCCRFEAEAFGRFGRPIFVAEWKPPLDAVAQRMEFFFAESLVYPSDPARESPDWPRCEFDR